MARTVNTDLLANGFAGNRSAFEVTGKLQTDITTGAYTLVAGDVGRLKSVDSEVSVPLGVFAVGDVVRIFNRTNTSRNLTPVANVTLRPSGTTSSGACQMLPYTIATLICVAANEFIASGDGVQFSGFQPIAGAIVLDPSILSSMWQEVSGTSGTPCVANSPVGSAQNLGDRGGIFRALNSRPILRTLNGLWWLEGDGASTDMMLTFPAHTGPALWWAAAIRVVSAQGNGRVGSWVKTGGNDDIGPSTVGCGILINGNLPTAMVVNRNNNYNTALQNFAPGIDTVHSFQSDLAANQTQVDVGAPVVSAQTNTNWDVNELYLFAAASSAGRMQQRLYGFVAKVNEPSQAQIDGVIRSLAMKQGRTLV